MVEKKRKSAGEITQSRKKDGEFNNKKRKDSSSNKKRKEQGGEKKRWRGPRLPNVFQKELDLYSRDDEEPEEFDFDDEVGKDVYEYEEAIPEEELMKNRRFDPVENYEFKLPKEFEDWKVPSDDEGDDDDDEDKLKGDDEKEDAGRHVRMLEQITGLPSDAFEGRKKKDVVISGAYPESEYNPSSDILDGDGRISIHDLLNPLQGKSGFSKLRQDLHRMEKSNPTLIPLPKSDKERVERKAVYELSKKDITKWEPLVKRNREAPTLFFDEDVDLRYSTIAAIASEFEPRTEFEKKMASLVNQSEVVEAHKRDGARLLELNEVSIEDVKERQARLGKMRSLLFRHELKAKRIKKIKSKTYHRLLKKDRKKAAESSIQMDPEAAKEHAMKQEFKRAEARLTLKHKNNSKWAKRILKRGLDAQDEATRAAFSEQLNLHASLTRKMNSMNESSSSDDSSDDVSASSDEDNAAKLMKKAKEKTLKVLEGDEELPKSGVLSLPFMVRGLKKKKEAADQEAKLALEEYESSLMQLENKSAVASSDRDASSGRKVYGVPKKMVKETRKKEKLNNYYGNSDSESDFEAKEDDAAQYDQTEKSLREIDIDPSLLREEFGLGHESLFKRPEDTEDPEPKTMYEVSYMASDSWKKVSRLSGAAKGKKENNNVRKSEVAIEPTEHVQNSEDNDEDSDTDSGEEMVDGFLTSGPKSAYELPSQAELIQRAFAGDDVEEDFVKDKNEFLNEENPEPEKPVLIPGWGQWTDVQKKKGLPSWMLQEHESAKKKRLDALKKRKDAHLNNVIISEKLDKKAEKLHTKTLPYPYTSQEVFEQSIRMPIGPEFNPATAIGALNRPEIMKRAGIIIKPLEYEDVSIHERDEPHKRNDQKHRNKNQSKKKSRAKA